MSDIRHELLEYIRSLRIISTHNHHLNDEDYRGVGLRELLEHSYVNWAARPPQIGDTALGSAICSKTGRTAFSAGCSPLWNRSTAFPSAPTPSPRSTTPSGPPTPTRSTTCGCSPTPAASTRSLTSVSRAPATTSATRRCLSRASAATAFSRAIWPASRSRTAFLPVRCLPTGECATMRSYLDEMRPRRGAQKGPAAARALSGDRL